MVRSKAKTWNVGLPEKFVSKIKASMDKSDWSNLEDSVLRCINNITDFKGYRKGDIIEPVQLSKYDFVFIFDGKKARKLWYVYNENGHVPPEFLTFTEFPPYYWVETSIRNELHFINPSLLNLKKEEMGLFEGIPIHSYTLTWRNKKYKIASDKPLKNKTLVALDTVYDVKEFPYDFYTNKNTLGKKLLNYR